MNFVFFYLNVVSFKILLNEIDEILYNFELNFFLITRKSSKNEITIIKSKKSSTLKKF